MLGWWLSRRIDLVDIAVRRTSGAMIWHRQLAIHRLPLSWLRAENVRGGEIYIRPARDEAWPLVFLDDVDVRRALAAARKYAALVMRTSPAGGCHMWLASNDHLDEHQRALAQRWLASRIDADPASTSGEHLGRLAGFRNWKRSGVWVNVLDPHAPGALPPWDLAAALHAAQSPATTQQRCVTSAAPALLHDTSPSSRDWAWVCSLLVAGHDPLDVQRLLIDRARPRRGPDAERYAARTIEQATRRRGSRPSRYRSRAATPTLDAARWSKH
jgi:hypothetical protein